MSSRPRIRKAAFFLLVALSVIGPGTAHVAAAPTLPGSTDSSRVKPQTAPQRPSVSPSAPVEGPPPTEAPPSAKSIHLTLRGIKFEGAMVVDQASFTPIYQDLIGHDITLDAVWDIAAKVTRIYRDRGYFLSRAYVPAQEIADGVVTIRISEGYIGKIDMPPDMPNRDLAGDILQRVTDERPLRISTLESALLRLNDLPGTRVRAVLDALPDTEDAAKLTLVKEEAPGSVSLQFDDYGSRYLGPYEVTASYRGTILPGEETSAVLLSGTQSREIRYGLLQQRIPLFPDLDLTLFGRYSESAPGEDLAELLIKNRSWTIGLGATYSLIRQRRENLSFYLNLEGSNSKVDILDTALSRDRVRVLRAGTQYDYADNWHGVSSLKFEVSQGLKGLGASDENALNVSRADARPDFLYEKLEASRWQGIGEDWILLVMMQAQFTRDSLYSSEEIGYGGQAYGRAYDPSEIVGDRGLMGSAEIQYLGYAIDPTVKLQPFGFYDIGKVWNVNFGQKEAQSGSSAGAGIRIDTDFGLAATIAAAKPLTREADSPLWGGGKSFRFLFQLSYQFDPSL